MAIASEKLFTASSLRGMSSGGAGYPSCPSNFGTGTTTADPSQFGKLANVVLADPPTKQETYWHVHKHPKRKGRTPFEG
jgi:hypothetical protein